MLVRAFGGVHAPQVHCPELLDIERAEVRFDA